MSFYKFRFQIRSTSPQHSLMVYCSNESDSVDDARSKAESRLNSDYPNGFILHNRIEVYDERSADANMANGLFSALSKADLDLWLSEREAIPHCKPEEKPERVRPLGQKQPKRKKQRLSALESQIAAYQRRQRAEQATQMANRS